MAMASGTGECADSRPFWRTLCDFGNGMYLMTRHITRTVEFGMLIIRSFSLAQLHFQVEAEKLNLQYPEPAEITT